LKNIIIESYKNSQVRIRSAGSASRSIDIKKDVKQGCPSNPLLFNICADSVSLYFNKASDLDYDTGELGSSTIQAYADDMILVSDPEQNLQTFINRANNSFDFADIKLNSNKCEVMVINPYKDDKNLIITDVIKKYVASNKFVKYLGVPMGSKRTSKTKFLEGKVQKVLEELNKVGYSGPALNQMIRTIRCYIFNKLYYVFANMDIHAKYLNVIDNRVRSVVNRFIKGQCLQKSFIYANGRNGELGVRCMIDECAAYKVHLIANLMLTEEWESILMGYLCFNKKLVHNRDFIETLGKALII
jgi:hypothetical protein